MHACTILIQVSVIPEYACVKTLPFASNTGNNCTLVLWNHGVLRELDLKQGFLLYKL